PSQPSTLSLHDALPISRVRGFSCSVIGTSEGLSSVIGLDSIKSFGHCLCDLCESFAFFAVKRDLLKRKGRKEDAGGRKGLNLNRDRKSTRLNSSHRTIS